MRRLSWCVLFLAPGLACGPTDSRGNAERPARQDNTVPVAIRVCARPTRGVIVSLDSVAGFSAHATLGTLRRQCGAGDSALYDAVGWQGVAWTFPFAGARVMAVQSKHGFGESVHDEEAPDLWAVEGDSVRLPDGALVPRTLGALRSRYGFAIVGENTGGDDFDGPGARSCRFPYLLFALAVDDNARHVPDSARVIRVNMAGTDTVMSRFCIAHKPPNER